MTTAVPWWGGTLTNNPVHASLGEGDAWPRWWGLARHRVALGLAAPVLGADALLRPGRRWWEWLVVVLALGAASPGPGQGSWAEWCAAATRYYGRRRVGWISLDADADSLVVLSRGRQRVWCYELTHRGRLDLSERDVVVASRLSQMVDSFAAAGESAHVSLHVDTGAWSGPPARTCLSVNVSGAVPPEWRARAAAGVPRSLGTGRQALLERRHYVRTGGSVLRTLRVGDFAAGRASAALETLGQFGSDLSLSLHADVVPLARARRESARAVHRVGAGAEFGRAAGFRWSAHDQVGLEALRQREQLVAQGAALCHWALYIVVRADSLAALRARVRETCDVARAAGLRLDVGTARQGEWLTWQLPGGPGW